MSSMQDKFRDIQKLAQEGQLRVPAGAAKTYLAQIEALAKDGDEQAQETARVIDRIEEKVIKLDRILAI